MARWAGSTTETSHFSEDKRRTRSMFPATYSREFAFIRGFKLCDFSQAFSAMPHPGIGFRRLRHTHFVRATHIVERLSSAVCVSFVCIGIRAKCQTNEWPVGPKPRTATHSREFASIRGSNLCDFSRASSAIPHPGISFRRLRHTHFVRATQCRTAVLSRFLATQTHSD